jgi:hypothetical protein
MHDKLYQFFNSLSDVNRIDLEYTYPARIWVIDNFLPQDVFEVVVEQINNINSWTEFSNYESGSLRRECRNLTEAPLVESLANAFNSSKTINWLESIVGTEGLIPDPHFLGGGLCSVETNSKLDLHTDFNWNNRLKLNRSVNLMLYLNKEWDESWGGALEFWDNEKTQCVQKLYPIPNRLAFWEYNTKLIHGFPNELKSPKGISRDNLIHFYYTSNATWDEDPRRSSFTV